MPYIRNKLFFLIFWKLWTEWKDCWLECLWWQQLCEEHGWDWELISAICLVVCFSKSKIDREFQRFVVSSQKVNAFPRILAWGHRSRLLSVGWTWHWYGLVCRIADSTITIIAPFDNNWHSFGWWLTHLLQIIGTQNHLKAGRLHWMRWYLQPGRQVDWIMIYIYYMNI